MRRAAPLLPMALGAWGAALVCVLQPDVSAATALLLWTAALVVLAWAAWKRGAAVLVALALVGAAAAASSVALAQPAREHVAAFGTSGGRAIEVTATVTSKVAASTAGSLWFDAEATTFSAGDRSLDERVPIAVSVAPDAVDDRRSLDLGARVIVRGTAKGADAGERTVLVVFASRGVGVIAPPDGVAGAASALRTGFVELASSLPKPGGGLLPGLAVGDTAAVGRDLDLAMKTSSLSHLTAVSGANCAIIVGLVFGAAGLLGTRRWVRVASALTALAGFVVLVTPEPSVVRAAAMATAGMLGVLLGRTTAGLSALSVGIVVLLVTDPWLAMSLGFALSVAATGALLVLAPPLARALSRWMPRALALALAVPVAAQLACGPLLVLVNPVVPVYGVLANIVAGIAAPPATVIGLAACLVAPMLPPVATVLAWIAWVPSAWIAGTAQTVAGLPAASVPWLEGAVGAVALAALGACVVVILVRRDAATWRGVALRGLAVMTVSGVVGAVAGMAALRGPVGALAVPVGWTIAVCDVGQGDAVLIRASGRVALMDTGPDPAPLAACLSRLGIGRIDLAVLTHFDLDHVGGADTIAGRVDLVLHGPPDGAEDERLLGRLEAHGARLVDAHAGLRGALGDARWTVLWPVRGGRAFPVGNDASIVVEIRGGGVPSAVFLGDLSAAPQSALAASGRLRPPYAVVKVAHHGSADQDAGLYRALGGALALVPVGADNDYGHPRAETLQLLTALGMTIARTDTDGLVVVGSDAEGVAVWRERAPPG